MHERCRRGKDGTPRDQQLSHVWYYTQCSKHACKMTGRAKLDLYIGMTTGFLHVTLPERPAAVVKVETPRPGCLRNREPPSTCKRRVCTMQLW